MLWAWLQGVVLLDGIEAGTLFDPLARGDATIAVEVGTEVAMTHDESTRIALPEVGEKRQQSLPLGFGAGVGGLALLIETALIADADGVAVVMGDMGPDDAFVTTVPDGAVALHVVMVAYVGKAAVLHVVAPALPEAVALVATGGRTVEYEKGDDTHLSVVFSPSIPSPDGEGAELQGITRDCHHRLMNFRNQRGLRG